MITYRRYRNTDPPQLVDVWNQACAGRGAYPLRTPGLLEKWVFAKPYFDPDSVVVAQDDGTHEIVGFALSGFGPNADLSAPAADRGVICCVMVRPAHRKKGVGRELVKRADEWLRGRGAADVVVGSMWPANPYLFGLYGGSNSPGILASDPDGDPFLRRLGYAPAASALVFQKKLDTPLTVADTRFGLLRRRYDVQALRAASVGSWWQECVWGSLEPVELRLMDKLTDMPAARAVVWELEGFSWRWNLPAAGVLDVQVRPDLRKQGLGKLIVAQVLRFLQDQFFAVAEMQVAADDAVAVGLCKSLGFEQVDQGHVYRKPEEATDQFPTPLMDG